MGIDISLSGFVSAVANMRGTGVISSVGIGFMERKHNPKLRTSHIEALRKEIRKSREKYKKMIPVIAEGDINSGKDLLRILNIGSSALQLGTRYCYHKRT